MLLQYTWYIAGVTRAQLGRPQKYREGWSSENKRICVLTKHLLSGESYELTGAKVFDTRWSSIAKGQGEMLAWASTVGLQHGCTPK